MARYPEILFHFTSKESLYEILGSSFRPSFARERIIGGNEVRNYGVPMVSFSDLRLSELKVNIKTYGLFGIGMKKEWAIRKGLNPVMYVSDQSFFTKNFLEGLGVYFQMVNEGDDTTGRNEQGFNQVLNTLRYMKNYEGVLLRQNEPDKPGHVFANEKEWRYVPPFSDDYAPILDVDLLRNQNMKEVMNQSIQHVNLEFTPDDIMYLIVDNDDSIIDLIRHLRSVKARFSSSTIDRLTSRILTYDQIEKDI